MPMNSKGKIMKKISMGPIIPKESEKKLGMNEKNETPTRMKNARKPAMNNKPILEAKELSLSVQSQ